MSKLEKLRDELTKLNEEGQEILTAAAKTETTEARNLTDEESKRFGEITGRMDEL